MDSEKSKQQSAGHQKETDSSAVRANTMFSASSSNGVSQNSRKGAQVKSQGARQRESLTNRDASSAGPQQPQQKPKANATSSLLDSSVDGQGGKLLREGHPRSSGSAAVEESKQQTGSNKSNSVLPSATKKDSGSLNSKIVTKKKKSRIGHNNVSGASSAIAMDCPIPTKSKQKKSKQNSDNSGKQDQMNNSGAGSRKAVNKIGSATSGQKALTSKDAHQMRLQTTSKGKLIGNDLQTKTVSNWDQSRNSQQQQEGEQQKMMATTGALSPRTNQNIKLSKLESDDEKKDDNQPMEKYEKDMEQEGQEIEMASVGNETQQLRSFEHQPAAHMPASPASHVPNPKRASDLRPSPLDISREIVTERDDESPSSPPVSAGPIIRDRNNQGTSTFGIKLQKLQVPKDEEASGTSHNLASYVPSESKNKEESKSTIIEETPGTFTTVMQSTTAGGADQNLDENGQQQQLTEPLPILPKVTTVIHMPVKCPIENVRFLQLKRFLSIQKQKSQMMSAGFDLVGQRRKMIQMKTEDRIAKKGNNAIEDQHILAKIDDTTHFIKSIVFARDPQIIDQEKKHVHQRDAFSHTNNLDVKMLVDKSKYLGEESKYASLSPRGVNRNRLNQTAKPVLDCQVYKLKGPEDKTLLFESRFESGNLYLSQKVSEQEYNLLMSNDINTSGHTQWFFFQVKNTKAHSKVRFNILNYSKPDSLFNYGMKVSVYSDKKSEKKNVGWHKDGDDIRYFVNGIRKDVTYYSKCYYTMTFTYTFDYDDDVVYFAYSTPYTYSDLRNDITAIEQDPARSKLVRKSTLCRTLSGELCEVLTITAADNLENFRNRKGIVLTARVHPGETVGSWMMRGCLTFLTDPDNYEAKLLRENFVFKVVPMLNPDGVINGNYRCSLAGCDLNRRWKTPNKTLHPTIFHVKRLVKQIHQERGLVLYCDFHGHSRKQNVFMYGCNNKQNPGECRIFPFILGKMNKFFCYEYSRFGVQKSKEATARVALYKELKNVPNIFTMESSFAGIDFGPAAGQHFTTDMLETLGHDCCRAILIYSNMYVPPELQDQAFFKNIMLQQAAKAKASNLNKKNYKEPVLDLQKAICNEINGNAELLIGAGGDDSSSGSDSAPSEDNMQAEELIKQLPIADKTLKQQLKKNEIKRKKEEEEKQVASTVKLRRQSSGRNLKKEESPPKRQMSPLKRPANQPEKKEEPKPEEKKKPKVETRDAQTQTDRSDYQLIKQKMLRERRLKEEQAAQQLALQKRGITTGREMQMISDLSSRPTDYVAKPQTGQLGTSQWLSQMKGFGSDQKSRTNPVKMPISSANNYHNQQHKHLQPTTVAQQHQQQVRSGAGPGVANRQQPRTEMVGAALTQQLPGSGNSKNPKLAIPEKKYNFMGVSTINQNQQQSNSNSIGGGGLSSKQPSSVVSDNNNEYGNHAGTPGLRVPANGGHSPLKSEQHRNDGKSAFNSQGMHQNRSDKIRQDGAAIIQSKDIVGGGGLSKADSRRSGNRVLSGGTGELPAMNTLNGSNNTVGSTREPTLTQQQYVNISSGAATRLHHTKNQGSVQLTNHNQGRNQNFETEPSSHRQPPGIFSPQGGVPNGLKAQFILPQAKQLPQKEFVMMNMSQPSKQTVQGARKASRNNGKGGSQIPVCSSISGITVSNNNYIQGGKFGSSTLQGNGPAPGNQMSRFSQQRNNPASVVVHEQTLARNNSTHCTVTTSKYAAPLGASPMTKVNAPDQTQQYSMQLTDMSTHSQPAAVTRNAAGINQTVAVPITGGSHNTPGAKAGGSQQPLRASYNVQRTPQGKGSQRMLAGQMLMESGGSVSHQYRAAMGNSLPHASQPIDHDLNCNKLPALHIRGGPVKPSITGRSSGAGQNSHQNAQGMINGLQIALGTPQQKIPSFQMGQHSKFQNQTQLAQPVQQQPMIGARGASSAQGNNINGPSSGGGAQPSQSSQQAHSNNQNVVGGGTIFSMSAAFQHGSDLKVLGGSRTPSQHRKLHKSMIDQSLEDYPQIQTRVMRNQSVAAETHPVHTSNVNGYKAKKSFFNNPKSSVKPSGQPQAHGKSVGKRYSRN